MTVAHADLDLALQLAELASEHALAARAEARRLPPKEDGSAVTQVDLHIEARLRAELQRTRPTDAALGEERGLTGASERVWLLDPLDGTEHYLTGRRDWGTNIALQVAGEVVLGVVTRPDAGLRWYATRGGGAFRADTGHAVRLGIAGSPATAPGRPRIAVWEHAGGAVAERLASRFELVTSDLDAILAVAEGRLDGVVDVHGRPWDHAPFTVLVEEAGGRFSDASGGRAIDQGLVCYSTREIHGAMLAVIGDVRGEQRESRDP